MKLKITALFFLSFAAIIYAADTNTLSIIPLPQKIELRDGAFKISGSTRIYVDPESRATGNYLTERLRPSTGYPLKISTTFFDRAAVANGILLTTKNANTNLGPEGYELTVASNYVVVRAPAQAGLFYGVQTFLQLLPPKVFATNRAGEADWQVPCVQIEDWPRFKWRGFMLDVSRHFFTKPEVKILLAAMAMQKMNVFHWHLTDDHGWRIEIKKYPKLTEIGAWRSGVGFGFASNSTTAYDADGRYGGFYTQDDIRDVVKYAAALHITVVPEIEMPGHATAALAAYPQLGSTPGPFIPEATAGVFHGIYNPANEETFQFLGDVIAEVAPLFPGKYFHIGGDEVPKASWKTNAECQALMKREGLKNEEELQSWFVRRIEKIVNANGHSMIGWSEILQGGLPQNAAVMDWIGGAKEAASAGHNVVMTPTAYCYFDFYQSSNHLNEPKAAAWGGPITLNTIYMFNPMPTNVPPELQSYILGTQGNLWTEQIPNFQQVEYMTFPRICALAEVTWSAQDARNWGDFLRRLPAEEKRLDELNINYRRSKP